MKKRKIVTLLCVSMTATALMTGCGRSTSDEPVQEILTKVTIGFGGKR